ncbi:alcohol dehydrogenase catalytic domain-containing protein [bacterium]|nr:alcohol dehydrogenase catalytic domain-containing protein [bacterium]
MTRLTTMLAVTVQGGQTAVQVPLPERKRGEALVRVKRVGICGTDLAMFDGYTDHTGVIGHEFAGVVEEADNDAWIGKRVTSSINFTPSDYPFDWKTAKHHPRRTALGIRGRDGTMAEYAVIPEDALIELPASVSDASGATVEPLAAAMDAVDRLPPGVGGDILVVGDGRIAQLVGRVLQQRHHRWAIVGRNRMKLSLAKRAGGRGEEEANIHKGKRFSRVIEATGSPEGIRLALNAVAPTGTVVLKSTLSEEVQLDLSRVVVHEIRLIGSRCGDLEKALEAMARGKIEVTDMITAVYPLARAAEAFEHARRPDAVKVQLEP